jgi:SAM-dependent methyltransferase
MNEAPMTLMAAGALGAATAAAREHGLLHALAEAPAADAGALADRLSLDPWATAVVLEVLLAHGLVLRDPTGIRVAPTVMAELRGPAGHRTRDNELWSATGAFLRTGQTVVAPDAVARDRTYRDVVPRLAALFEDPARRLAESLADGLPSDARVLDVGAGSGVWSLAVAQRVPDAHVVGLDLAHTVGRFAERAEALGLSDRAAPMAGDYNEVVHDAPRFDVVIFANVLHLEPPDRADALIRRHGAALRRGGRIVVVDALPPPDRAERFLSAYGLHLALRLPGARPHAPEALRVWMSEAGCRDIRHVSLDETGLIGALVGTT